MVTVYFPGKSNGARKKPSAFVFTEREMCVASSSMRMSAFATTRLVESNTVPEIAPVPGVCARAAPVKARRHAAATPNVQVLEIRLEKIDRCTCMMRLTSAEIEARKSKGSWAICQGERRINSSSQRGSDGTGTNRSSSLGGPTSGQCDARLPEC